MIKMTKKQNFISFLMLIVMIIGLIIADNYIKETKKKKILSGFLFTKAKIVEYQQGRWSDAIVFSFEVNMNNQIKTIKHQQSIKFKFNEEESLQFIKKKYIVIYSVSDPSICSLIFSENNLKDFFLTVPDSLSWIKKYYYPS